MDQGFGVAEGKTGSRSPWMTSVGAVMAPRRSRIGSPMSMANWVIWLEGTLTVRARSRRRASRILDSSKYPEFADMNIVRRRIDDAKIDTVVSNSFGFGGTNATLVLARYDA